VLIVRNTLAASKIIITTYKIKVIDLRRTLGWLKFQDISLANRDFEIKL